MSYQVLARKWRPRIFREMVGQEHVLQALINALDHNRLHHAYLFTGTRGVGKTTIARILAKCLNCETGVSSEPCGQCSACCEIAEGRFVDLIEVDAASRTKVEDTRELLENVQYAPSRGRYKVYLIDEVHMLSNSSFNALLKTLEEPPPHVKFLLATTDPQKLPMTILSRCLQFNLKNMNPERIVQHLKFVLDKELVPFEESALWQLGRSADGSMRDAMSLTDQAISYGSGKITEAEVRAMLGTIDQSAVYDIATALVSLDGKAVLNAVERMSEHAPDYANALAEMLSVLHRVAIAQALPEAVDNSHGDKERIIQLAQQLPSEDVQLFYQTALLGRRDLPLAPDPRAGFEMVLLRMLAFKPQGVLELPTSALPSTNSVTAANIGNTPNATAAPLPTAKSDNEEPKAAAITEQFASPAPTAEPHASEVTAPTSLTAAPMEASPPAATVQVSTQSVSASSPQNLIVAETRPPFDGPYDASANNTRSDDIEDEPENNEDEYSEYAASPYYVPPQATPPLVEEPSAKKSEAVLPLIEPTPNKSLAGLSANSSAISSVSEPVQEALVGNQSATQVLTQKNEVVKNEVVKNEITKNDAVAQTNDSVHKVSLEQAKPDTWPQIYLGLGATGLIQSTISHCQLVARQGTHFEFVLDNTNSTLYDASQQQRLADLLSDYFIERIQVSITLGAVTADTPAAIATRYKEARQADAVAAIQEDPIVMRLIAHFDAIICQDTIVPL